MSGKRKTYYRINNGKIEKVRRVVPPDGWTTDKKSLENLLLAKQTHTDRIIETDGGNPTQTQLHLNILRKQVNELKEKTRIQETELRTLRKRATEDTKAIKRIKEERRDREISELERTAEFAKNGFPEEEYYHLKNIVQGLREQVEGYKEKYEEIRAENDNLHKSKIAMLDRVENYSDLVGLHYSAVENLIGIIKRNINDITDDDEKKERLLKRIEQIDNRCRDARKRCGWKPSMGDPVIQ